MTTTARPPNTPYCSNCGYDLSNLTDSSRCPECGRPLVEVLVRAGSPWGNSGKRYRSKAKLLGLPVIDVAMGPHGGERVGRARGVIAVGDIATGLLAVGGMARGLVAFGGLAIGLFALGGGSVGLLVAMGGFALGGYATGGGAVGGIASGGGAIGYIAQGGGAVGYYARGGGAYGKHVISPQAGASPEAVAMFDRLSWLLGNWPPDASMLAQQAVPFILTLAVAVGIVLAALAALRRESDS